MNNNYEIIKTCITIDIIYQKINIKKALIICDFINLELINKLKEYNHNIALNNTLNSFLDCKKRLLILTKEEFKMCFNEIILDEYIDTIFLSNVNLENTYINNFSSKIFIYNV